MYCINTVYLFQFTIYYGLNKTILQVLFKNILSNSIKVFILL